MWNLKFCNKSWILSTKTYLNISMFGWNCTLNDAKWLQWQVFMAILVLLSQLQKIYKLHTCALLHRFQILYIGRGYNFFIYLTKTSPTNSLYSFPGDCLGFFKGVLQFSSHTSYTTSTNKQKGSTVHILPPLVSTKAIVCFLSVNRTKQSHPPPLWKQIHYHVQFIWLKLSHLFQAISDKWLVQRVADTRKFLKSWHSLFVSF